MQNLTVGIIGCGVIAPTHIKCYQAIDGVRVKWACDLIKERARMVADSYNLSDITSDYHDVLQDPEVDCISICTDHRSHTQIAVDALHAGKHILCEKALASSSKDVQIMLSAHKKSPELVFSAVFQHRFDGVFRFLHDQIKDGAFGTITAVNLVSFLKRTKNYYNKDSWRGTWEGEGGSLLINQSIHYIDLILWLCGEVDSVCARWENLTHGESIETEDTAAVIMRFKSGLLGSITATSSSSESWRNEISISGTEGYVRTNGCSIDEYKFNSTEQQKKFELDLKKCMDDKAMLAGKDYYGDGHPAQIADFINAVLKKRKPFVEVASAASTMELIYACYESSRSGKWINL